MKYFKFSVRNGMNDSFRREPVQGYYGAVVVQISIFTDVFQGKYMLVTPKGRIEIEPSLYPCFLINTHYIYLYKC